MELKELQMNIESHFLRMYRPKLWRTNNPCRCVMDLNLYMKDSVSGDERIQWIHSEKRSPQDLYTVVEIYIGKCKFSGEVMIFSGDDLRHGRLYYRAWYERSVRTGFLNLIE